MTTSPEELQRHYAELSDAALMQLAQEADTLTPQARIVLDQELERRSLTVPEIEADTPETAEAHTHWITIDRFRDLSSAIVARGALEASEIPCFLRDENTVRLDWQISNLIGGMRLQVHAEDRDAAIAVLSDVQLHDAQTATDAMPLGDLCPFCGSTQIHPKEEGFGLRTALLWVFTLPVPRGRRYWSCDACGRRFTEAELDRSESA